MVWDPTRITPRSWADVVQLYRRLEDRNADFRPMRVLAEHVASGPHAARVFAATSGTALLVAARSDARWAQDALRVDVHLDATIRFVAHRPSPARPAAFGCEAENIVDAFEGFLRKAAWVA
jgi:hypothetical protein